MGCGVAGRGCGLSFHSKWILPTMLVIAFLRTWFTVLTLLLNLFQLSFCFWAYHFICHFETSRLFYSAGDYLYQLWFFFSKRIFHFLHWNSSSRNIFNNPNIWNFLNFQTFTDDIIISIFSTVVTTDTQSAKRTSSLCNLWLFSNS